MIEIKNISKSFEDKRVFKEFSLDIKAGEFVILAGKSGSGKTTLLNMLGGLEKADEGQILVDDYDVSSKKGKEKYYMEKVGFLFQNFALMENLTVRKNLELVQKKSRSGTSIEEALDRVGLKNEVDNQVYKLSGGEQQRVALARLIYKKCDLILADEPTGSLDADNAKKVMNILTMLNEQGKTIVLVTHDEKIIESGKRVVRL